MAMSLNNQQALGLVLGLVAVGVATLWVTWEPAMPVPSAAHAPGVNGVQSVPGGPQTPEYARLQHMADEHRANTARERGGSAVPSPPELQSRAGDTAPDVPSPPQTAAPPTAAASAPPRAAPPDETDRLTTAFARAMHNQAQDLMAYRERFEPPPTRMVVFEDVQGQRARAEAEKRAEVLRAESRAPRPRDGRGLLQPGDILFAVLQTAINSDEPGPVRAQVVGERFKGAMLLGTLATFPPVVGSRPERVQVAFNFLTTPDRQTHAIRAYAIDTESARTALATGVDHHTLERWGSLLASSFLEGYGQAVRNSNSISTVSAFGSVVTVPKDGIDHGDIAREALGTVGQRMSAAVAENFQRPNTITVAAGTGIGVLMVAPVESRQDTGEPSTATAASPTPRTAPPERWPPASDPVRPSALPSASR